MTLKVLIAASCICVGSARLIDSLNDQTALTPQSLPKCTADLLGKPKGYLFDLDGTVFNNQGWLKGSPEIFSWMAELNIPYALLTNGFKTQQDVLDQFSSAPLNYDVEIDPAIIHTAGLALGKYLETNAPPRSRIFLLGGTSVIDGVERSTYGLIKAGVNEELFNSLRIRTDLTMDEIYEWSHHAFDHKDPVFVVIGGDLKFNGVVDPVTQKKGYTTLDFDLLTKITVLLRNGARLVTGASDRLEARQKNNKYPSISTAWPAVGALEQFLLSASNLKNSRDVEYHVGTGKGGSRGAEYMIQEAVKILQKKNPDIKNDEVVMVGDNLGTDILTANQSRVKSIFVLCGAHKLVDVNSMPGVPTCYLNDLSELPQLYK